MKSKAFLSPMQKFIKAESFSGILLFISMALALILSNSPIRDYFNYIWEYEIGIKSDNFKIRAFDFSLSLSTIPYMLLSILKKKCGFT